ncbi:MAG: hypothetical protein QOD41_2888, partial [Cryptosporangiaceae bacterium]|nr:hypothetical protein [Cryptosporangiaceae bacterium]
MRQRAASLIATLVLIGGTAAPAAAAPVTAPTESHSPPKTPVATGFGGAVSSVDADATAIGLD